MITLTDWLTFKDGLPAVTVHKDALHIYAALIVQVLTAIVFRKSLGSVVPWAAVLVAESVNEALDIFLDETEPRIQEWQLAGAAHDLVNTLILPTVLLLLVRYVPDLFRHQE